MPSWLDLTVYERLTRRLYELPMPPATGVNPTRGKWTGDQMPKETPPDHPQHDITMAKVKKAGRAIAKSMQTGEPSEEPKKPEEGEPEEPEEQEPEEKESKKKKPPFGNESFSYRLSW